MSTSNWKKIEPALTSPLLGEENESDPSEWRKSSGGGGGGGGVMSHT